MRVVGIAIITALLSAGCAIQAGEPQPEEGQRPNELVNVPAGDEPGVNARPDVVPRVPIGQNGPAPDSGRAPPATVDPRLR